MQGDAPTFRSMPWILAAGLLGFSAFAMADAVA